MPLDDHVIRPAKGANLATVVTLMPDGQPQAQYTWIDADGEYLLVNTVPLRQRYKNVQRNPRITVTSLPGSTGHGQLPEPGRSRRPGHPQDRPREGERQGW